MANSFSAPHPDDSLLLRYIDGEVEGRKRRQISKHLEACWTCRAEVEQLQATMTECVRYRQQLAENLPAAPVEWRDLYKDFDRIDAESKPSWLAGLWTMAGGFRWAVTAAAAVLVSFGVYYQFEQAPSVKAAELLKRAAVAAKASPARVHRVRIRSSRGEAGALPLFQLAKYDSLEPLTAHAYQEWRNGLTQKSDEFSFSSSSGMYHLRTSTVDGAVSAASLTVRGSDLEPVEGRLDFRNQEWVEFSELPEPTSTESVATGSTHIGVPSRSAVPSRPAAVVPGLTASISDELQVLAALHRIGADLGDPVQVSLQQGEVLVSGVGVAAQRQQQIEAALNGMPHTGITFSEPAMAPANANASATSTAVTAANPYEARLEAQVGGKAAAEKFAAQVMEWNEAAMSRAYALRALAQRFPSDAALSDSDRAVLRNMASENVVAMNTPLGNTERTLGTVLTRMGAIDAATGEAAVSTWEESAQEVFRAARRVDTLSSLLLGAAPGDNAVSDLPSELLRAVNRLQADLDQCQRLLRK